MNLNPLPIPSWDEYFMRHVYLAASKSKDARTRIGAVLIRDKRIIAEGYNGLPIGVDDLKIERQSRDIKDFYFEHGERNAIYSCARFGISALGTTLYTQGVPCANCARAIIQAGIKEVVVHKQWGEKKGISTNTGWRTGLIHSETMFKEAGVKLREFDMVLGVTGLSDEVVYINL